MSDFSNKLINSIKRVLPGTIKTCLWMIEMTVIVSFAVLVLRQFGILDWLSRQLGPLFSHFGLPGEAALAYVTGYFVNNYSAIAVAVTLGLDVRQMTILAVMALCSHNMFIETSVQKMTGSKVWDVVLVRTLSGIILAFVLNLILPSGDVLGTLATTGGADTAAAVPFMQQLGDWAISTLKLCVKMTILITLLNFLQAILTDFGIAKIISRFLKPLMTVFGLPEKVSFLWIIANVVGLGYGAAAMKEELRGGNVSTDDVDLLNTHIGIAHSNLEDLTLFASVGGIWWVLLLSRWAMAAVLVWGRRGIMGITKKSGE